MKKDDQILRLRLEFNHFVEHIILIWEISIEQEFYLDRLRIEMMLFLYNNHFCLIWESEKVSFNQAIEELKDNFKTVDNYITEKFYSHFKYEFIPKKIESHLTNFIVYDPETHITDRARPYWISF